MSLAFFVLHLLAFAAISAGRKLVAVVVEFDAPVALRAAVAAFAGFFADIVHRILPMKVDDGVSERMTTSL